MTMSNDEGSQIRPLKSSLLIVVHPANPTLSIKGKCTVLKLTPLGDGLPRDVNWNVLCAARHIRGSGGACLGDSVASVNVTFFSSHHLRYRFRAWTAQPSLRTSVSTPTALRLV